MNLLTKGIGQQKLTTSDLRKLEKNAMQKVLVVRPNSRLGNQLLITPLLQEIIHYNPDCQITVFVRGNIASILFENYRQVKSLIKLPSKPFKHLADYINVFISVRKKEYDLVVNIDPGSSSGRLLTRLAKAKVKIWGDAIQEIEEKYPDYKHMAKKPVYNFRYYFGLDLSAPLPTLSIALSADERRHGKQKLFELVGDEKPTICIYTFATGNKCYSKDWWQIVYTQLKERFGDRYHILEVLPKENISQIDFKAINYYSTDIREMAAVMANTAFFFTGDCGVMHLASAAPVPTLGCFSTTSPEIYAPYNPSSVVVETAKVRVEDIVGLITLN